jgi:hypothetical protein
MRFRKPRWSRVIGAAVVTVLMLAPHCFALPGDTPPRRLIVPSIGIDAAVDSVGLTPEGAMGVPTTWTNVAWYNLGVAPGVRGNAVMAGHLDTRAGTPAVFWRLGEVQPGADVFVVDGTGATLQYRVTGVTTYRTGTTPLDEVFGPSNVGRLNLITCTGTWNRAGKQYDHRLVVSSELVGSAGSPPVDGAAGAPSGATGAMSAPGDGPTPSAAATSQPPPAAVPPAERAAAPSTTVVTRSPTGAGRSALLGHWIPIPK